MTPDTHGVTGPYANPPGGWPAVIEAARLRPQCAATLRIYDRSRHPACLNSIAQNADANLRITYYTGRVTKP